MHRAILKHAKFIRVRYYFESLFVEFYFYESNIRSSVQRGTFENNKASKSYFRSPGFNIAQKDPTDEITTYRRVIFYPCWNSRKKTRLQSEHKTSKLFPTRSLGPRPGKATRP